LVMPVGMFEKVFVSVPRQVINTFTLVPPKMVTFHISLLVPNRLSY